MKKALLALALVGLLGGNASAVDRYWDINGTTAGAGGPVATGTWNAANTNWNTDSTGVVAPTAWTAGDTAIFSAGSDATGAFTVTLGVAQTAAGLTIDEGSVSLAGSALALGTGTATVNSGATLSIPSVSNVTQTAGSGGLALNGGTFRMTNAGSGGSFWDADGSITLGTGGGTISYNDGTATLASSIYTPTGGNAIKGVGGTTSNGGAGTLTKIGADEFRYQGAGLPLTTFAKLVVSEGLYRLGFSASVADERGFGAVPLAPLADAITLQNGGAIGTSFNSTLHVNRGITLGTGGGAVNTTGGTMTIPSAITGSGDLAKNTAGTLTLSGNNDYTGNTLITAGTLIVGSTNGLGSTSGNTQVSSGAELRTDASTLTIAEPITIAGSGNGGTTGAINVQNNSTSTFTGPITLSAAATVTVSGSSTATYSNAAAFTGVNQNLTLAGGSGAGGGGTVSGAINLGTGSLTKNQSGAWRLTAANTYSGGTVINGGTIYANNATGSATGSGSVTVNTGGTLAGTGTVSGPVIVAAGGTLAPGASVESLNTGALSIAGTLAYELDSSAALAAAADLVNSSGGLSLTAGALLTVTDLAAVSTALPADTKFTVARYDAIAGWNGITFDLRPDDSSFVVGANTFVINYNDATGGVNFGGGDSGGLYLTLVANPTAVPEASAMLFGGLACCAAGLGAWRRRRA